MSIVLSIVAQLLHIGLVLLAAPLLAGALAVGPAMLAGRSPPPFAQPWRDLVRLFRKQAVRAENGSVVGNMAPLLSVALAALGVSLVPSFALGMASAPLADLLSLAALFALGRVVGVLAAMDAGSGEGGLAAAESGRLAMLVEPALWLAVFALALLAGGGTLDRILAARLEGTLLPGAAAALAIAGLALLTWAACAGSPMDEAYSGRDLALLRIADGLRLLAWCDLIGALALPIGMASAESGPLVWTIGLLAWTGRLALTAAVLSVVRILAAKHRLPAAVGLALMLCAVAAVLALTGGGGA
jgi:formate hydrogenlyase subunit 4